MNLNINAARLFPISSYISFASSVSETSINTPAQRLTIRNSFTYIKTYSSFQIPFVSLVDHTQSGHKPFVRDFLVVQFKVFHGPDHNHLLSAPVRSPCVSVQPHFRTESANIIAVFSHHVLAVFALLTALSILVHFKSPFAIVPKSFGLFDCFTFTSFSPGSTR